MRPRTWLIKVSRAIVPAKTTSASQKRDAMAIREVAMPLTESPMLAETRP